MASKTEPAVLSDGIKWEEDNHYSRKQVTIASGETIAMLQVLGIVTASGKYAAYDQDATDGTEEAAGIAVADYDASAADVSGVAIVRQAMADMDSLVWPDDITDEEQAAAVAELEALGIIAVTTA